MTRNPYRNIVWIAITLVVATPLAFAGTAVSGGRIIVESMEIAALDALIRENESRYLIALMAAWCGPCKKELPALIRLYAKYRKQGLKLIGISLDLEGPAAMQPTVDRMKVNFPVYCVGEKAVNTYGIKTLPMLWVVRNGGIEERLIGHQKEQTLEKKIRDMLD